MRRAFGCPVCGSDDCGRHPAVLMASAVIHTCLVAGLGLLIGLLVWSATFLAK
jgi:hypothetical protein